MRTSLLLIPLLGLSACGGVSSNPPVSLDVPGFTFSGTTITAGTVVHFGTVDYDGETTTGEMSASVLSTSAEGPDGFSEFSEIFNNVTTTLPTGPGGGSFSGSYVASWGDPVGPMDVVIGDVDLEIDSWSSPTISGTISNRILLRGDGPSVLPMPHFEDVVLGAAVVDGAGIFSGATTGGEQVFSSPPPGVDSYVGTYNGIVGGANGTEVAGQVSLVILYDTGETYSETGVFLAE